ncbi:ubiquitin carboxyl-terminal hydrolase [Mucor mucedo]|uniref:ubiquitin carboxyl-terminal hydrolase n=1 Tax=Mucor mucedo TaxID=29922 RepID=UPI0022202823|nr:ubiquitin carboxyl-terminal hydrolase [Mucor mucedo]KAI7880504.1 ubiquitin carboxyl-terminal hydrolase [Mucor mucedo]
MIQQRKNAMNTELSGLNRTADKNYWGLVTSDPDVFNDMLKEYGVKDTKAEELFSLDFENLEDEGPVHGLIVITEFTEEPLIEGYDKVDEDEDDIIFSAQVVTNACGTLALIGVLLNADISERGEILNNFLEFTRGFSPINRGLCLGNSDEIRRIHNAYAPAHQIADELLTNNTAATVTTAAAADSDEEGDSMKYETDYHYVTYIFKNGFLWEMNGLDNRPKKICPCTKQDWLTKAEPSVQRRMADKTNASIIAIKHDPLSSLVAENALLKTNLTKFDKVFKSKVPIKKATLVNYATQFKADTSPDAANHEAIKTVWDDLVNGNTPVKPRVNMLRERQSQLESRIKMEEENRLISSQNICRQKFDYFPFLTSLISKAYKRKLLDDDESEEELEKLPTPPKKRKNNKNQPIKA